MARVCCDDLVDRLRYERERQGISQEEITRRGGPTAQTQWEIQGGRRGPRGPAITTVIAYADALDYEVRLVRKAP